MVKSNKTTSVKKSNSLKASNSMHEKLRNRAMKSGNQQKEIYHGACIIRQEKLGRILTRNEREKVYDDVILTFW